MLINSSTVAGTIPAPRSWPLITFLPTSSRSGSCPVFTCPPFLARFSHQFRHCRRGCGVACTPACTPQAALICAATAGLTVLSCIYISDRSGSGCTIAFRPLAPGFATPRLAPPPPPAPSPSVSAERPKMTKRGVASWLWPSCCRGMCNRPRRRVCGQEKPAVP